MVLMRAQGGRSWGVTLLQLDPLSLEIWTKPSSEPAQRRPCLSGGFGKGEDAAHVKGYSSLGGDGATGHLGHFRDIVGGKVRAYDSPAGPLIGGAKDDISGDVEDAGVVGR